jgi:hypothetical protein
VKRLNFIRRFNSIFVILEEKMFCVLEEVKVKPEENVGLFFYNYTKISQALDWKTTN